MLYQEKSGNPASGAATTRNHSAENGVSNVICGETFSQLQIYVRNEVTDCLIIPQNMHNPEVHMYVPRFTYLYRKKYFRGN
jgi:hypothetical protein